MIVDYVAFWASYIFALNAVVALFRKNIHSLLGWGLCTVVYLFIAYGKLVYVR